MALTKITSDVIGTGAITSDKLASGAVSASSLSSITTDNVSEGSTNTYFTNARARGSISVTGGGLSYDSGTGVIQIGSIPNASLTNSSLTVNSNSVSLGGSVTLDTDDIGEGSTNLYFTNVRAQGAISGGTGVTVSGGAISIGQDVATSSTPTFGNITTTGYIAGPATFTIDPAAVGDNTGTVVIAGNLQVDGTTTTINSTTLEVDDLNITLASGAANAAAANGAGITVDGASATITYDGTNDEWDFNKDINVTGTITSSGNITGTLATAAQPNITSLGTLTTLTVDDITINDSTISDAGTLTIDAGIDLTLDADSGNIFLKDGGTHFGTLQNNSSDLRIVSIAQDKDLILRGNDGGTFFNALTLDMSNAGAATFNSSVRVDNSAATPVRLQLNNTGSNDYASIYADTASAYKNLVLNPNGGNVGIGTSGPLGKLHVRDGSAQAGISHTYAYDGSAISIEATEPTIQLMAEDSGTHGGSLLWRYGNNAFAAIANPTTDAIDFTYGVTTNNDFQVHSGTNMSSYLKIMSIGADGNVGIGTNAPTSTLEIHSSAGAIPDTTNSSLQLRDTSAVAANNGGSIVFSGIYTGTSGHLGSGPYIKAYKLNATDGDYSYGLKFATRENGVGSQVIGLTITPDQKVGIGTTNPGSILDIRETNSGGVGPTLSLINGASVANGNAVDINMAGNPGGGALAPTGRIRLTEDGSAIPTLGFHLYDGSALGERMTLRHLGGTTLKLSGYASMLRLKSGAGAVFGHNVEASNNANEIIQSNTGYYGSFIKMYYNKGIAFHTMSSAGTTGDVIDSPSVSGTERMMIDSAGLVGIGTTSPTAGTKLDVQGGYIRSKNVYMGTGSNGSKFEGGNGSYEPSTGNLLTGSYGLNLNFLVAVTGVGVSTSARVDSPTGDFYTNDGTISSLSDERVKGDITTLSDGLEIVKQLRPVTFKYTDTSEDADGNKRLGANADKLRYGFIAQEVEAVAPQYVETGIGYVNNVEVSDFKSLSTTRMIPMLLKSIQEQQTIIESLKARITALES